MQIFPAGSPAPTDSVAAAITPGGELSALKSLPLDDLINNLASDLAHFAISLAIAVLVFYVGKFIIRKLYGAVAGMMLHRKVDRSLGTFVLSLVRIVLYFILIVTVIGILGINTSSFIALFASAGVAVGMALSGTLQNFAGGVLILLLKPYKIGDYIEAQGFAGTVTEIQIFSTIICTFDNKSIIIPNGGLSTGSINNWSREEYRRIDWSIAISYGDNVATTREAILQMLNEDSRIVHHSIEEDRKERNGDNAAETPVEPMPQAGFWRRLFKKKKVALKTFATAEEPDISAFVPQINRSPDVVVSELADSSVNLTARAWVRTSDYWAVYFYFNEKFYTELPLHGVHFPFPQLDVHLNS